MLLAQLYSFDLLHYQGIELNKKTNHIDQTKSYAKDLVKVYKAEKAKRIELEEARNALEIKNEELKKEKEQLRIYAEDFKNLYEELLVANSAIKKANIETIYRLSVAAEYRDNETSAHIKRVSEYAKIISTGMGLDADTIENIKLATPMHDIGKLGISDAVLLKSGKYTDAEYEQMKEHANIGHLILENSNSMALQLADSIAFTHHEKYDGTGYPRKLKGDEIPVEGRIAAIADVYDALSTKRPYKKAFSKSETLKIMTQGKGTHFDPHIFDSFMDSLEAIEAYQSKH